MKHSHLEDRVDDWILCEVPGDQDEKMTYPAPALVHIIYSTALMASFLLTGWLYVRAKGLADRNPDQRGRRVLLTPNRYTLGIAAVLVAWVVRNIVLSFIGMDR